MSCPKLFLNLSGFMVKNNCFLQEQLKYKSKFNFVTFDGQAVAWREKLAEINEDNLEQAQSWIKDIKVKWRMNLGEV